MINYYLVQSPITGKYYSCSASDYTQATRILKGWLVDWNVIHSCNGLVKHVSICKDLVITKTNILRPQHISGRRNNV